MLVVSPFSRGGLVSSQTYEHTSMLRFLETRFRGQGPEPERVAAQDDRGSDHACNFAARANATRARLPSASGADCSSGYVAVGEHGGSLPRQERRRLSQIVR